MKMNWKVVLLAAVFGLTVVPAFAAERVRIKAEGVSMEFSGNKLLLCNASNGHEVQIGRIFYTWSPQVLIPVSAEQLTPETMKVEYRAELKKELKASPEKLEALKKSLETIRMTALCTVSPGSAKIEYTLDSPSVRPQGAMQELVGVNGFKRTGSGKEVILSQNNKNLKIRLFARNGRKWALALPGNQKWNSSWAEHAGFRKSNDHYTTVFEFRAVPEETADAGVPELFTTPPAQ